MTKVKCPWRECKHNRDGICTAEEIELAEQFAGGFYYLYCKAYKGAWERDEDCD
ncbi:MAG: DUF1540 domain-containing protein [Thaumarchaeota archaeon]|nr:DUF1540 domain-containing protein [Nitrososphaerota archaeon]